MKFPMLTKNDRVQFFPYVIIALLLLSFVWAPLVFAVERTTISTDVENDFVLEPTKNEVILAPGKTATRTISVTNRSDKPVTFTFDIEDFTGSQDPENPVLLLGDKRGPYSLKDYLNPEVDTFTLEFGEKIMVPVEVSVPEDAEPGGYYGAVIVSNAPSVEGKNTAGGSQTTVISRASSLFLVRVKGEVEEKGEVTNFKMLGPEGFLYSRRPEGFEVQFQNTGNVHLVPYGEIVIRNLFGNIIDRLPVDAYFSLPDSLRYRQIEWSSERFLLGYYTAELSLYPGFGEEPPLPGAKETVKKSSPSFTSSEANLQTRSVSFLVLPWKLLLAVFALILLVVGLGYMVMSRFEIRRK